MVINNSYRYASIEDTIYYHDTHTLCIDQIPMVYLNMTIIAAILPLVCQKLALDFNRAVT
jgi:hypothetical protein